VWRLKPPHKVNVKVKGITMAAKSPKSKAPASATAAESAASPQKLTPNRGDLYCIAAFLMITALLFSGFIFSDSTLSSSDELSGVDMKELTRVSAVEYGQIPTWFATRLSGMPSIDAMFSDALYPPTMVVRMFMPVYRSFGWMMVLHVFLAGLFFFLMLRRSFGVTRLPALAGALFYMLSPQFVSLVHPGHSGKMFVIAWLPYVVWRLRSLLSLPTLRNACLMAIGIAMMVLSPHVQMTYFVLMGIFLYWATDTAKSIAGKDEKKRIALKAAFFWMAVFVGLGLSFVQLYPSYMFVRDAFSVRGVDRGFDFAASWSMNWAEVFSLWVHEFGNSLEYYWGKNYFKLNTEYAGAVPLLLTVLALASKPKSLWRIFWAAVAVLAVLYALGANTPIFTLFYYLVPGVKRFRAPCMIMFWITFATALMSVYFIKDLLNKRFEIHGERQKKWAKGLAVALGAVTLVSIIFSVSSAATSFAAPMMGGGDAPRIFQANFAQNFVPNLWFWWLICAVTLGMLLAIVNDKLRPSVLVYTLIILGAIDMIKVDKQFITVETPRKYFYQNDPTLTALKSEFAKAPFRVFTLPRTFPMQNQEGVYGLEGVSGFHDNELVCYRAFRGEGDKNYIDGIVEVTPQGMSLSLAKIRGNTPFLDLADVDYILLGSGSGAIDKIKNPTSLGRLSYAADYVVMGEGDIAGTLKSGGYDYRTAVALLEEPELPFARKKDAGVDNGDGGIDEAVRQFAVEWKKYTPNLRIASVNMPDDGFLRISEVYYPGWKISVNGSPVKYYRSDIAWMAVPLKAGDYEVTLEPKSLYLGFATTVSIIFFVITVAILVFKSQNLFQAKPIKVKIF
jgi:hypothetical protein